MKTHKVVITNDPDRELEPLLRQGWLVKNVTALHVTTGDNGYTTHGKASYVLEKDEKR